MSKDDNNDIEPRTNRGIVDRPAGSGAQLKAEYDERSFWEKIKNYALSAGEELVTKALTMYYCAKDKNTPKWVEYTVYGALAYFILPVDAIPDIIPGLGYTDDLGVILAAFGYIAVHITDEHKKQAKDQVERIFT